MKGFISLLSGLLFGFGLALAQMTNPAKIIDFLDFSGTWDPTLALVMGGAVLVTLVSFRFILRRPHPLLGGGFQLPTRSDIDIPLIAGAAIFGIGWGLGGLCPGPGIAAIAQGIWEPVVFTLGLAGGMLVFRILGRRRDSCFQ
ncbi:MAG: DUF6691 family protein [Gammaproteobacteria bacterium]